jgi:hypothetical protein
MKAAALEEAAWATWKHEKQLPSRPADCKKTQIPAQKPLAIQAPGTDSLDPRPDGRRQIHIEENLARDGAVAKQQPLCGANDCDIRRTAHDGSFTSPLDPAKD